MPAKKCPGNRAVRGALAHKSSSLRHNGEPFCSGFLGGLRDSLRGSAWPFFPPPRLFLLVVLLPCPYLLCPASPFPRTSSLPGRPRAPLPQPPPPCFLRCSPHQPAVALACSDQPVAAACTQPSPQPQPSSTAGARLHPTMTAVAAAFPALPATPTCCSTSPQRPAVSAARTQTRPPPSPCSPRCSRTYRRRLLLIASAATEPRP